MIETYNLIYFTKKISPILNLFSINQIFHEENGKDTKEFHMSGNLLGFY